LQVRGTISQIESKASQTMLYVSNSEWINTALSKSIHKTFTDWQLFKSQILAVHRDHLEPDLLEYGATIDFETPSYHSIFSKIDLFLQRYFAKTD
jgi:hypothetical protein